MLVNVWRHPPRGLLRQCELPPNVGNHIAATSVLLLERCPVSQVTQMSRSSFGRTPCRSRMGTVLWWIMLVLSLAVVAYGLKYFVGSVRDKHFATYILPLRLHIAGGMGALLTGPWQFSDKLRARNLNFHRWLGRIYLLSVALGSTAGLAMSVVSLEGLPTHLGFGILAALWFSTALQAYLLIRRGEIEPHRRWMIRNFALSLAAVTLRIYMPLMLAALHWPFRVTYITVSWLCWIPNLLVAEWLIARDKRRPVPTS